MCVLEYKDSPISAISFPGNYQTIELKLYFFFLFFSTLYIYILDDFFLPPLDRWYLARWRGMEIEEEEGVCN